jgi:REP element-mobilizing transposase RayT
MLPQPLYTPDNLHAPAYHLRYTWSGWPSSVPFPALPDDNFWNELDAAWETDGLRRLTHKWTSNLIQFTFSVTPKIAPTFFASRVKGRLQHALRKAGTPVDFSRKLAVRTIGDNSTQEVESYITNQVPKAEFVNPRYEAFLQSLVYENPDADLSQPAESQSGRYWYNLHLVLVVHGRGRIAEDESLRKIHQSCLKIAEKKGYCLSRLAVLPDHLHLALRGVPEQSPEEIALAFMNNLAYALGQRPIWEFGYYVGTFSEYDMGAVRQGEETASPAGQAGRGRGSG